MLKKNKEDMHTSVKAYSYQHIQRGYDHCDPGQGLAHERVQCGVASIELAAWVRLRLGLGLVVNFHFKPHKLFKC